MQTTLLRSVAMLICLLMLPGCQSTTNKFWSNNQGSSLSTIISNLESKKKGANVTQEINALESIGKEVPPLSVGEPAGVPVAAILHNPENGFIWKTFLIWRKTNSIHSVSVRLKPDSGKFIYGGSIKIYRVDHE